MRLLNRPAWKENLLEEVLAQSNRLHDPRLRPSGSGSASQLAWLQAATALLNNGMAIDEGAGKPPWKRQ